MTVQQPAVQHHVLPWWLELVAAAMIGAALLFGTLLVVGHSDLVPSFDWGTQQVEQVRPILGK